MQIRYVIENVGCCEFQVLNETSLWWFDQTRHITPNAVVSSPDKNVTIAKKCSVFPVEFVGEQQISLKLGFGFLNLSYICFCFVVRGFVTGSTDTSLWTVYNNGVRNYCGNALPDGAITLQSIFLFLC